MVSALTQSYIKNSGSKIRLHKTLPWCLIQLACVLVWFTNHLFGKVIDIAHNWFKRGKNRCSITLGFEVCQEMEVTPGRISICTCLFEIWSQNLSSSKLYFLEFHYEIIVILPWLIIVNWIWFIYIICYFYTHDIWWYFFIPNS